MRKNISLYISGILVVIFLVPSFAMAKLVAISEEVMGSISGQAGIQISFNNAGIKMNSETIYYGDDDGVNGRSPAYLSLCNVNMDASIHTQSPLKIDLGVVNNPFNQEERIEAVMVRISDLTVDIDNFNIGAIRVGSQIGQGKSFGSFGIKHMHAEITGNIMVWAH